MNWTEITIKTSPEATEAVYGVLYAFNAGGISVEDSTLVNDANRSTSLWDVIDDDILARYQTNTATIKAYFPPETNIEDIIIRLREGMTRAGEYIPSAFDISTASVDEQDWENSWKKYYKPIRVGRNILIKPLWETAETTENDIVLELDPGMAFGTGTHETTRMCLALLEDYINTDSVMLDIGTGSGILAIAAAKMGAQSVTAGDIDPVAVKIARENAEINKAADKINIVCGNLTECIDGKYNIITANIIADAIIQLTENISGFLTDDGIYITSGIINHRIDDVKNALEKSGFIIKQCKTEGDWAAIVCTRSCK